MPAPAPLPGHPQAGVVPQNPNAAPSLGALSQYRLDAGDQLRVIVFGQEALTGTYRVDDGGSIAMPLLPPVGVRGLTTAQTKAAIEQALSQTLLRNPNVSVEVATFRPFFILGQVNQPGQYPFVSGMTVETAVAIAGGYTFRANTSRVRITRAAVNEFKTGTGAQVMPGDTIFVRERYF
ncbi:MAG: polysaccharide biosynthesis/export family protein [Candidatus Phaeomarinobacter sp.]